MLVVTADHGELLGEHGEFGHGRSLYEPVLRVPLLVRYPPRVRAGVRVSQPVSTAGVFATILDLTGLPPVASTQVASLLADRAAPSGPVLAEQYAGMLGSVDRMVDGDPLLRLGRRFRAYRAGTRKLIEQSSGGAVVFDLASDPGETRDVAPRDAAGVSRLRAELETWRSALGLPALDAAVAAGALAGARVRRVRGGLRRRQQIVDGDACAW